MGAHLAIDRQGRRLGDLPAGGVLELHRHVSVGTGYGPVRRCCVLGRTFHGGAVWALGVWAGVDVVAIL